MATRIREARAEDLPGLAALLDEHEGPSPRLSLLALEPARLRAWVAVDDGRIAAMTCAQPCRLQIGARTIDAARWGGTFGAKRERAPLVRAMLDALTESGISRLFGAGREPALPDDLRGLGVREVERYKLRIKPLRPLSLAAKQLRWPQAALRLAEPLDRLAGLPLRVPGWRPRTAPRGHSLVRLSLPEDAEGIVALLDRARAGLVARRWDARALGERYESDATTLLGLCHVGEIIGVVALQLLTRETPQFRAALPGVSQAQIRVGAILELAARDDDADALALLLRASERFARDRRAEAMLLLDSLGPMVSKLARRAGYLDSGERRLLSVAAAGPIADGDPILDAHAWRLPLAELDSI